MPNAILDRRVDSMQRRPEATLPCSSEFFWSEWVAPSNVEQSQPEEESQPYVVIPQDLLEAYRSVIRKLEQATYASGSVVRRQGEIRIPNLATLTGSISIARPFGTVFPANENTHTFVESDFHLLRQLGESTRSLQRDISTSLAGLTVHQVRVPTLSTVLDYLRRFPGLTNHLPAICSAARQEFGVEAELSLALYRDPEIDDQYLTLYIRLPDFPKDIMDRIEAVSRRFDDQLSTVPGQILLTTDFRRLRG